MAAAVAEIARRKKKIKKDFFRRNAFLIIQEMVELSAGRHSVLVDEVLHSILFLGHINNPQCTPEKIVSDVDMLNALRGRYPHPFECYSTQLPKRAPISCVLEMIVNLTGQEKEEEIYEKLLTLILRLKEGKPKQLVSNAFCVSQLDNSPKSARYYGVSMSTSGPNPGRVMIAASCLRYWDSRVASAVMTYNLINQQKNPDFDGTITLPDEVRCQAFKLIQGKEVMPPCKSCSDLFGLTPSDAKGWRYGNCAELESLSRLLQNERAVRVNRTLPFDEGRARQSVLTELRGILRMLHFNWDEEFYTPQD